VHVRREPALTRMASSTTAAAAVPGRHSSGSV
jgi:hypothetical protein